MTMKKYSDSSFTSLDSVVQNVSGSYTITGNSISVTCASINASGSTTNNWSSIVFTTNSFNGTMNKQ